MDSFEFAGYPVSILRRPYQRTIGVTVKPNGLIRVTTSRSSSTRSVLKFLNESRDWIHKIQDEFKELRNRYSEKKFLQGEAFLFLGKPHYLNFQSTQNKKFSFKTLDSQLDCYVPQADWNRGYLMMPQQQVKPALLNFYKNQGKKHLQESLTEYSQKMDLYPKQLSFRSQKSRWGSCSSRGHISLNWRLVASPKEVLDYVVVHELAHLKHQNHSARFWSLVEQFCPEFTNHKKWLRKNQYDFDFLSKNSELHYSP